MTRAKCLAISGWWLLRIEPRRRSSSYLLIAVIAALAAAATLGFLSPAIFWRSESADLADEPMLPSSSAARIFLSDELLERSVFHASTIKTRIVCGPLVRFADPAGLPPKVGSGREEPGDRLAVGALRALVFFFVPEEQPEHPMRKKPASTTRRI